MHTKGIGTYIYFVHFIQLIASTIHTISLHVQQPIIGRLHFSSQFITQLNVYNYDDDDDCTLLLADSMRIHFKFTFLL